MRKNLLLLSLISCFPILISACGSGSSTSSSGQVYYSASNTGHYLVESNVNPSNESQLYISVVSQNGGYVKEAPLTQVSTNNYTFSQSGASGTVTIKNGNFGISYNGTSSTWIDFATQNVGSSVPSGNYNLICDQTNLSPCTMNISNNSVNVTEYSLTGQATTLCNNSSLSQVGSSNLNNPYLFAFTCGVNGGSSQGVWYIVPIVQNSTTGLMIGEYNAASNNNNDETDEIAFPANIAINPNGSYNYLYNGGSLSGVGVSTAQFTATGLINQTVGLCSGAQCALIQNQYYNNNPATGFDWYNVNSLNNYNLVGSDSMSIYQDSFEGFYF